MSAKASRRAVRQEGDNKPSDFPKSLNRAWEVIKDTKIIDAWTSIGTTVNLVGSLKTGLLIEHLDIDFHVYTSPIILAVRMW